MSKSVWKKGPWKKLIKNKTESQVGWAVGSDFERQSETDNICRYMNFFYASGALPGVEFDDFRYLWREHRRKMGSFTKACSDRTKENGFKLEEYRFRLVIRKKVLYFYKALEQVARRSCGCPILWSVQGQVGWDTEQPCPRRGCWNWIITKVPSNPNQSTICRF